MKTATHKQAGTDPKNDKTLTVTTVEEFYKLSYYTLCKLQDTTHYANPMRGLPGAIARGEFKGELRVDSLGNFISFN